jgi:hypothetical protein
LNDGASKPQRGHWVSQKDRNPFLLKTMPQGRCPIAVADPAVMIEALHFGFFG